MGISILASLQVIIPRPILGSRDDNQANMEMPVELICKYLFIYYYLCYTSLALNKFSVYNTQ